MRNTTAAWLITTATMILGMTGCQTDEMEAGKAPAEKLDTEGMVMTKLGKKLENPYTVANMQKAYENLLSNPNARVAAELNIEANHYYVRFFPRSKEEIDLLEADSLELFNYPIDYELDTIGNYYAEEGANIAEGLWYWTAVSVDYQFPNVEYEVLDELFLVDDLEDSIAPGNRAAVSATLADLEDEALKITGNWEERQESKAGARDNINPRGTIRVWNTETNNWEGVAGVLVRTSRWFNWSSSYTHDDGSFYIFEKYKYDIRYSVKFENQQGFKIWNTLFDINTAEHNRGGFLNINKYSRTGWNKDFGTNEKEWRFCTVNNAVVKYLN
jgi:hypothetical protein